MNTPCGIMDQFVSALAQQSSTLLVDCRSNAFESVPLDDPEMVFVVANSGVRHKNSDGAYAERVRQCREAVEAVRERTLGCTLDAFDEKEGFFHLGFFGFFQIIFWLQIFKYSIFLVHKSLLICSVMMTMMVFYSEQLSKSVVK